MMIEWDYINRTVTLLILGYVKEALSKFQYATGEMKWFSPFPYTPPQYGKKVQLAKVDKSEPMTDKQIKLLQKVC